MLTIAVYVKALKEFAKNRSISNESFARSIFEILINHYDFKNQRGEPFDLNKSRISKILTGKADVPKAIREVLAYADIEAVTENGFEDFCSDYLDEAALSDAVERIQHYIEEDSAIPQQTKEKLRNMQNDSVKYLAHAFLTALKADNTSKESKTVLWSRGNSTVELIFGDLFRFGFDNRIRTKGIIVIPVNTAFDTHISYNAEKDARPVVSENTLHGQWIKRITQSGTSTEELDQRITESLRLQNVRQMAEVSSVNGKPVKYPIGSISVIDTPKAIFYLLAVSEFDENNVAHSTASDIKNAIRKTLIYYNQNGQGYNLYMPLIGSGRSRAGMDYQDSLDAILTVLHNNSSLIQGNIFIVAQPQITGKIKINGGN